MKPLPKPEDPAAVQAALTAVLERPAAPRRVHAWACARCGDDRKTEDAPPKPRLCPRCAARILEMHTEPATPKRYGDDDEDDGAPIDLPPAWRSAASPPVAREHVQADTPVEAPACPIGEQAAPTVAAEEGETGMGKTETKRSAPKREPVGPARRPCGCGLTGRHLKTCALAPKEEPGVHVCPDCGKDCLSRSGLGGHSAWCEKRKERLGREAAPAPSPYRPGSVADRAEKGDPEAIAELARPEPWIPAPEPPSLRCLVVRVRGAVPLEVECATPEDAAAFVRLVSAGGVS